jgi:hypothetical protein
VNIKVDLAKDGKHCSPGCGWLLGHAVCSLFREGLRGQQLRRDASGGVFACIECHTAVDIARRWEAAVEREKQDEALDDILEAARGG